MRYIAWLLFALAPLALAQTGDFEARKGVEYATHDGAKLAGDLYLPKAQGPHPVIVAIHGGGWQIGGPFGYQHWGPYLASRGYGVFAISYRLSKPGQKTFPEALHDVRAAIQFLKGRAAELRINPERIGVMGDSAGGHLGRVRHVPAVAARSAVPAARFDRREVHRRERDRRQAPVLRCLAALLCLGEEQLDLVPRRVGNARRHRRLREPVGSVHAGAQASRLLRAPGTGRGRPALLGLGSGGRHQP
ncbi:MAG: alpha/beta hydrolase [Betaproteobacteria bacterium]|nr:MAG: alpha/beta hydrolase [Betaproteobacteria bacterium]